MDEVRLGAILLEGGIVGEAELERCLSIQSLTGGIRPLGEILVEQGLVPAKTRDWLLELQRSRAAVRAAEVPAPAGLGGSLLQSALDNHATELVVSEGRPVRIRAAGEWRELVAEPVRGPQVWDFVREVMGVDVLEELADRHHVVRPWHQEGLGRGMATAFRQFEGVAARVVFAANAVPSPEDVGLPPAVVDLVRQRRGLVLLVAERGIGRTDTMSALLQAAAIEPGHHVLVLDDEPLPLPTSGSPVARRRFGISVADRAAALRSALREDPDVLAIADVGDPECFELAQRAADGGRLVICCIAAAGVVPALQRIWNGYGVHDLPRIGQNLAAVLRAVFCRQLLPEAERTGQVAATEFLLVDEAVRDALRRGELGDLGLLLRMPDGRCGRSLDQSMLELLQQGRVRLEDVFARAEEKAWLLERTRELQTTR